MSFVIPAWAAAEPPSPPPAAPDVDTHRLEGLVNGFIAAKQDALFGAPDAFYRQTGAAAVDGVAAIAQRLSRLREATLDRASDDEERTALGPRLDAHLADALDGIDRHARQQRDVRNRQIVSERQTLIERAAELEHNDDEKLSGLAGAHASAALELARMNGEPEAPAIEVARSAIWRRAIGQRLVAGQGPQALALFERVKDQLVPADQRALNLPIQAAATNAMADQWIERETAKPGEPLIARAQSDPGLSPEQKAIVRAKVEARDSVHESNRIATVQGLDDQLDTTTRTLSTAPATYRPGTFAAIADAYDAAGEPEKARDARRLAQQEPFLLPFAQSSAAAQQRLIDSLPHGEDRAAAETIQRQQAEAFAKDAFTAGTALYPVGPPVPIDNLEGRIAQACTIAGYRGIPVAPFTADEIATLQRQLAEGSPQERDAVMAQVKALPDDIKVAFALADQQHARLTPPAHLAPPPPPPPEPLPELPKPPLPPYFRPKPNFPPDSSDPPPPSPPQVPPPDPGNEIARETQR